MDSYGSAWILIFSSFLQSIALWNEKSDSQRNALAGRTSSKVANKPFWTLIRPGEFSKITTFLLYAAAATKGDLNLDASAINQKYGISPADLKMLKFDHESTKSILTHPDKATQTDPDPPTEIPAKKKTKTTK